MQHRKLGGSGIEASAVALGTWAIGGWLWGGTDRAQARRAIEAALDAGIDAVDTAPVYGFGLSEEIVGEAVQGRRGRVAIMTKCGLVWDREDGEHFFDTGERGPGSPGPVRRVFRCLKPESVRAEVEASLRRLGTDYIDLYQTHWQDPTTPIAETMDALLALKAEGKIRAVGVSNATASQIAEYRRRGEVDADQEKFGMLDRKAEASTLPYCRKHSLAFLAYSPLARGLLTGKVVPDREYGPGDERARLPRFRPENVRKVLALLDELRPLADELGLSLSQLAIAWTAARPGCTHVLVGARTPEQARENAGAGDAVLGGEELERIDRVLERHRGGIV